MKDFFADFIFRKTASAFQFNYAQQTIILNNLITTSQSRYIRNQRIQKILG